MATTLTSPLTVDELRAELSKRGLSTAGIKPTLVRRLAKAEEEEKNQPASDEIGRKRQRVDDNEDDSEMGSKKVKPSNEDLKRMTVKGLREKADLLGLSATGSKKELIERLLNDDKEEVEKEEKEIKKVEEEEEEIKRVEDDSEIGSKKMKPSNEDLKRMTVKELREKAELLGLKSTGSKKELIERLLNGDKEEVEKEEKEIKKVEEEEKEIKKVEEEEKEIKKEKSFIKKGAAVLDQFIPDEIKSTYHVLAQHGIVYDATLNQTNLGGNNNKFYIIQVLESDAGGNFMVFNRWGRVGSKGQQKMFQGLSKQAAIAEFEDKFYSKTKNFWENRHDFVPQYKLYTWLEMDYSKTDPEPSGQDLSAPNVSKQPRETKLEARVANFISLICSISMMREQMMEIGYNAEKLPLGKLSKSTILKGYDVLKRISDVMGQTDRKTLDRNALEHLSGEFYTVIPHDFGYKKMREFVINTPQKLKAKLEMVEALGEIEVAAKLLEDDTAMEEDPMYTQYQRLHCDLTPVEVDSDEFSMIGEYMRNTHAKTHSTYKVDIVQIFRVSREGEDAHFCKFSTAKNKMLLWHGSRLSNWAGILSQGLRIAPPEAPVTGYMFGKGVYFADMFSKSANYCFASKSASSGVLLLCEVALGDMAELMNADYNADKLPKGKLSTKGIGRTAPDPSEARVLDDNVVVPLGKPKEQQVNQANLLYNEYIVYNVEQIKMRYVLHVNFNYRV